MQEKKIPLYAIQVLFTQILWFFHMMKKFVFFLFNYIFTVDK